MLINKHTTIIVMLRKNPVVVYTLYIRTKKLTMID